HAGPPPDPGREGRCPPARRTAHVRSPGTAGPVTGPNGVRGHAHRRPVGQRSPRGRRGHSAPPRLTRPDPVGRTRPEDRSPRPTRRLPPGPAGRRGRRLALRTPRRRRRPAAQGARPRSGGRAAGRGAGTVAGNPPERRGGRVRPQGSTTLGR